MGNELNIDLDSIEKFITENEEYEDLPNNYKNQLEEIEENLNHDELNKWI